MGDVHSEAMTDQTNRSMTSHSLPLVEFECGCTGFEHDAAGYAVILESCTRCDGDNQIWGGSQNMVGKAFKPMNGPKKAQLWNTLVDLVESGYKYYQIKSALR